ncbi:hypothetical protein [Clostridium taeniosporum]|uniref:Lipoprotein n=1 Tax=Clostridium taeniosporum TaxID=394958 RepID=A0A1D7XPF3_9CLOT|nr:hypothetical protein [Clostridium taeniosporum]AOR25059.1 hypothetical protein BGI42_15030 [Clostridium taeniosporum]
MKRYILLASIVTVVLVVSGCTNNKISNENMNNKSIAFTETTTNKEKSDLKNDDIIEEEKKLEASYEEKNGLKKPDIEEARDFEASLKNGSVIMISRDNSKELEVYNITNLDNFIDSFNKGKEGYVRIIKGSIIHNKFLVNKLDEYETDGKIVKSISYDAYSNKDKFTAGSPIYSPKIVKTYPDNSIRYAILESKDTPDNMGATVISFDKSSIKN